MADEDTRVWVSDPLVKLTRDAQPAAGAPKGVRIDAVRNEYESGQVVVTAGSRRIERLTVSAGALAGPSGAKPRLQARFVGFVPVKRGTKDTPPEKLVAKAPADIADPLLEAKSVSVEPGKSQPVWLTVYVPKTAQAGTYTGSVAVHADGVSLNVPVSVTVHPLTLPDERTLHLTNWFSPGNIAGGHGLEMWSEPFWKMLGAYANCMAEHRQSVAITPIMMLIKGRDDGSGKLTFDFAVFDRWVELFQKAGVIGTIEGGHLGGRSEWEAKDFNASWPSITMPDGSARQNPSVTVTSDEYRAFLSQFLPALQKHLEHKGWLDNYLQHLCDEPIPANAESYKKLASYVREYAPKFRIIDACMSSDLVGAIDVWVPLTDHFDREQAFFKGRQKAGDEVWFYTCLAPKGKYMNRFIDYPTIDTRLMHWVNYKYGLTGYLHWGFNYWHGDPFADLEPNWGGDNYLPPGDSHIVYPGRRGPLSSIRLEALRDGIEDFELLKLLEKRDPKAAREIADSVVRSLTDYALDPGEFRTARIRLVAELTE